MKVYQIPRNTLIKGKKGMEILQFDNAATPRRKKNNNLKSLAGLATVAAIAVLGSTLAANISLGTGAGIEFGQGVQVTAACDDTITVTPTAKFVNASNGGTFYLSTISFTGIDTGADDGLGCDNKVFTVAAYNDSDATPLQLATVAAAGVDQATFGTTDNGTNWTATEGLDVASSATSAISLGFGTPSSTSGAVYKITLQSSN